MPLEDLTRLSCRNLNLRSKICCCCCCNRFHSFESSFAMWLLWSECNQLSVNTWFLWNNIFEWSLWVCNVVVVFLKKKKHNVEIVLTRPIDKKINNKMFLTEIGVHNIFVFWKGKKTAKIVSDSTRKHKNKPN